MYPFQHHSSPFCWSYALTHRSRQFSFTRFRSWCRQSPIFMRWEECCSSLLLFFKNTFIQLPRCFTGTLLLPFCLHQRPIPIFCSVGAALMRFTWAIISERRILVSNFSVTCNSLCELHTLDRLRHVSAIGWYLTNEPNGIIGPFKMIAQNVFNRASSHQIIDMWRFEDRCNIPQNLPPNFHLDPIAAIQQRCLPLLCARLVQQSHLFLICVAWTCNDSRRDLHRLCRIPRNCQYKWL